eukprot:scaffold7159_cov200-Alexandrium_tamarense.AAC.1
MIDIPIENIVTFEAIKYSSFVVYIDGSVNGCGKNDFGQLGDASSEDQILTEVQLDNVVRLLGVGPSAESVFFVADDESVWATGLNDRGQLGVGDFDNRSIATRVMFGEQVMLSVLSASEDHTIALGISLGTLAPTTSASVAPTVAAVIPTGAPSSTEATAAPTQESLNFFFWGLVYSSAGSKYSLIILSDGSALSAGFIESINDYQGHLGMGDTVTEGINEFKLISVKDEGSDQTEIEAPRFNKVFAGVESTAGVIHTILLDQNGN